MESNRHTSPPHPHDDVDIVDIESTTNAVPDELHRIVQHNPLHLFHQYHSSSYSMGLHPNKNHIAGVQTDPAQSSVVDSKRRHSRSQHNSMNNNKKLDETIRMMDFLFGQNNNNNGAISSSSSSVVDGTIQILDQYFTNTATMIHQPTDEMILARNEYSNNVDARKRTKRSHHQENNISRMISPHGRFLYLVSKGSKTNSTKGVSGSHESNTTTLTNNRSDNSDEFSSSYYLCIPPSIDNTVTSNATVPAVTPLHAQHQIPYCSCRSFMERNRIQYMNSIRCCWNQDVRNPVTLCKHLLAISLLPTFSELLSSNDQASISNNGDFNKIPTMEFASEEDYSRAIIQRLFH